jgi:hypothetical protein
MESFSSNEIVDMKVSISPADAQTMIEENHPLNRPVDKGLVELYARDMKAGLWRVTGDPIRFDTKGRLIDGQHRLHAIILSGVTLTKVTLILGLGEDVFPVIDQGKSRTNLQALRMQGLEINSLAVAIARASFWGLDACKDRLSPNEIKERYEKYKPAIDYAAKLRASSAISVTYAPIRVVVMRGFYHLNAESLDEFVKTLDSGEPASEADVWAVRLRNAYLAKRTQSNHHDTRTELMKRAITALSLFREGNTSKKIIAPARVQLFPLPHEEGKV